MCVYILCIYVYIYIWANYNNSLTWNKAILGMVPLTNHYSSEGEQWGRYNLPRYMEVSINGGIPKWMVYNGFADCIYLYNIYIYTGWWLTYPSEKWWSSSMGLGWHPRYEMENNKCSKPPTRSNQTFSCGWQTLSCSLATHWIGEMDAHCSEPLPPNRTRYTLE